MYAEFLLNKNFISKSKNLPYKMLQLTFQNHSQCRLSKDDISHNLIKNERIVVLTQDVSTIQSRERIVSATSCYDYSTRLVIIIVQ